MTAFRNLPWLAALLASTAAGALTPDLASLGSVPSVQLPPPALEKAFERAPPKDQPYEYAVPLAAAVTLADGRWDEAAPGVRRWRARLSAPGALSLSLHFAALQLPPGARLWIYDAGGALVHGPYDDAAVSPAGLWTPIVRDDEIVVEIQAPAAAAGAVALGIAQAFHGFRDWKAADAPGKSGACNIDVACEQAGAWRDEARSVARIQIGGRLLCSGQLVSNVRQDDRPLFLTADHCAIGDDGGGPADSVVFYWNYQASGCGGARDGDLGQTQTGAVFLADDVRSDFTLLRLAATPPQAYHVRLAGWNVTGATTASGASIHHPSGDEKSVSLHSTAPVRARATIGPQRTVEAWEVEWSAGTTEQGSSGAGLWDANHQVIGVLSGGTASCDNPSGHDFYGRLEEAWTAGSAADSQLKAHLDPDGTCIAAVPGRDPGSEPAELDTALRNCGSSSAGGGEYDIGALGVPALLAFALLLLSRRQR